MRRGSRASRVYALGLLASFVGTLAFAVVIPMIEERNRLSAELKRERKDLTFLSTRIRALEVELAKPAPVRRQITWAGKRTGEVSAELQVGISTIASQSGFPLRSLRTDQGDEFAGIQTLVLEVEFETRLDQAMAFFELADGHKPVLILEEVSLRRVAAVPGDALQPSVYAIVRFLAPVEIETSL